jgi:transposase InsO family protein
VQQTAGPLLVTEYIGRRTDHLLHPSKPNRVWHADLTETRVLWARFQIAVVLDGYSRKLLALKAIRGTATTSNMLRIVRSTIEEVGEAPRFLITDRGTQFRRKFQDAVGPLGTTHVLCRVGGWQLNAKVERQFRTLKHWRRRAVLPIGKRTMQRRIDAYRHWYNDLRPHAAHGGLTPAEAMVRKRPTETVTYRRGDESMPVIMVRRRHVRGIHICSCLRSNAKRRVEMRRESSGRDVSACYWRATR